ncbi:MAG: bifunctional UDP-N-acetylglucosamine diphosphorylase/glucosamine-1-phosphate N-acetyltransferase GlmU [Anaerolineae bacterium]|nr:bifunctional UDP-N-acetylglucosamine diphosphorylase/glucosamine-1-phosphate N-acetyltransferase GlmU [Anaerolineae bacterium]
MRLISVILAAGQGTRMRSALPKMLHPLAGQPMVLYALDAVAALTDQPPVLVVGHGAEAVGEAVGERARLVTQQEQLGTAHAVRSAEALCRGRSDLVLVTYGDMPLLTAGTLERLVAAQKANPGPFTLLTVVMDNPHGFGRIIRKPDGSVLKIVEEAQASQAEKQVRELNVGAYCFRADWLWDALPRVQISPKGEYYLTDAVELAVLDGLRVDAIQLVDPAETVGINTRVHLAEAEALLRQRINTRWMLAGVGMVDPARTYIDAGVTIGQDTILYPDTYLRGASVIGAGCRVGPNSIVEDSTVGDGCTILSSVMESAVVENDVEMGPFCHLRKGAHLASHVHMGNFGEVKNSYLGEGTKMGHFSYIGDAHIGRNVNIGAGTITCNYDGEKKNKTVLGDNVFTGSDTMLVAPVTLGEGAVTGAGAVVTRDVPAHALAVGVPAKVVKNFEEGEDERS